MDVVYSGDGESVAKMETTMVLQILVSRSVANNANEDDKEFIRDGDVGVAYHDSGEKSSRKRYK